MSAALETRHSIDYIAAFAYAQGQKDGGNSKIQPRWFALAYESALENWKKSSGTKKKFKPVHVFFKEFMKNHESTPAA